MQPLNLEKDRIILEFKVRDEASFADTVEAALAQLEEKQYAQTLIDQGIAPGYIRRYGFAFGGKKVLIG